MTYEEACFLKALRSPDNEYFDITGALAAECVVMLFVDCVEIVTEVAILAHHLLRYAPLSKRN